MPGIVLGHHSSPGPVPQYHVEIVTPRRQHLTTGGEIDAVDASLVLAQPGLQLQSLHEGLEGVVGLPEGGEGEDGIRGELPGVEGVQGVGVSVHGVAVMAVAVHRCASLHC